MGLALGFWLLAAATVASALAVVTLRDIFRAAIFLVLCFVGVAGVYILLSADFLAAVQVLIYVGAISVLIILAIMMTREIQQGSPGNKLQIPAFIVAVLFLGVLIYALTTTGWNISTTPPVAPTSVALALKLLGKGGFVLPAEIAAVLLLSAILGAIVIAREK